MDNKTLPKTLDQAIALEQLLSEPLNAKKACSALYDVFQPRELAIEVINLYCDDPSADARELIRSHLADALQTRQHAIKFWEPEAVEILDRLCQNLTLQESKATQCSIVEMRKALIELGYQLLRRVEELTDDVELFAHKLPTIEDSALEDTLMKAKLLNKRLEAVVHLRWKV